ncbi:hypothetical protein BOX15_Mlig005762g3 [Macrostomum lignano]|uniref:Tr-type G domain-containing protein n=1 Tax=Macrostomum lignano TaxID=282301 RepID=A0A267EIW0_9PLAT|nr:hypothetical protein BOX15_Mlig005762g3 [Macrostomum lignano]
MSWEEEASQLGNDVSKLNIDAPVFVPGRNINAPAFVPGQQTFTPQAPAQKQEPSVGTSNAEEAMEEDKPASSNDNTTAAAAASVSQVKDQKMDSEQSEPSLQSHLMKSVKDSEMQKVASNASLLSSDADKGDDEAPSSRSAKADTRKEHLSLVFVGHVDAGKSTIGGHLLYLTGMVDQRTLEKYEREAKEKNRETWYLSWALDTNAEEREKGKTVEVGRAYFETNKKHFTVLDAPGHKSFVPNMIGGASQADLAILVISARKGEFETGFEKGGQTREHAMLVKTAGVRQLIVLINKMDDPTVQWAEQRYEECKSKLTPFLRKCGFASSSLYFMPCSGLTGGWLRDSVPEDVCPWYRGPTLLDYLDQMPTLSRLSDAPLRLPIADKYRDMGTIVMGRIEAGRLKQGDQLLMMPNRVNVDIVGLWWDELDVSQAESGDSVKLKLRGVEEEEVSPGFVLCHQPTPCHVTDIFDAKIMILEHKSIICAGYSAVLHLHTCVEEVSIKLLICILDKKTGEKQQVRPKFLKQDQLAVVRLQVKGGNICVECYSEFPQMGRVTLRDEGRTVAIGNVVKILPPTTSVSTD